jgi:hypothetical protein
MVLDGYDSSSEAVLDCDESMTVDSGDSHAAPDTTVTNYAEAQIATDKTFSAKDLVIDASSGYSQLEKLEAGTLSATEIKLDAGSTAGYHAKLIHTAGTISPDSMVLDGYDSSSEAVLDCDQSMTVDSGDSHAAPDTTVTNYAEAQIATDKTFSAKDLVIDASSGYSQLEKLEAGTLSATEIKLDAGSTAGYHAKLIHTAGTMSPDSMVLDGYDTNARAQLDCDQSMTVDSGDSHASPDTTMRGHVEIDVADDKTLSLKDTLFDLDGTFEVITNTSGTCQTDEFKVYESGASDATSVTKSGAGTLSAGSVLVQGSGSYSATLTVSAGSIVTQ